MFKKFLLKLRKLMADKADNVSLGEIEDRIHTLKAKLNRDPLVVNRRDIVADLKLSREARNKISRRIRAREAQNGQTMAH
jgi:hypothetical protein